MGAVREPFGRIDKVVDLIQAGIIAVPGAGDDTLSRCDGPLYDQRGSIGGGGARANQVTADDIEKGVAVEGRLVLGYMMTVTASAARPAVPETVRTVYLSFLATYIKAGPSAVLSPTVTTTG